MTGTGYAQQTNDAATKPILSSPTVLHSAANEGAPLIRVRINGQPVNFSNGEPVEAAGSVLVPMRGIFERLGASVVYDDATHTIRAVRGETTVTLRPGDGSAEINGESAPLSSPAQFVNGSVVVPLRFVSEALGAQVQWNSSDYEVAVNTPALTAQQLPAFPGDGPVIGSATGLYPEANLITVRIDDGENVRVPLLPDSSATRSTLGTGLMIHADSETLPVFAAGAVRLGEQVKVERNADGNGVRVQVDTDLRRGELKSIDPTPTNGGHQITLSNGTIINLLPNALVTFGNRPLPLESLKTGEHVAIRLDASGNGVSLAIQTEAAPNVIPPYPDTTTATTPALVPAAPDNP